MWRIKQILEADYGCEERMPGENGIRRQLEAEDDWLRKENLDEGSIWPEELPENT